MAKDKSNIVRELPAACADERLAVEFMEAQRWQGKPYCPHCGTLEPVQMRDRDGGRSKRFLWRCANGCKRQFGVRIGTVLEDSRIPLRHWCYAFWAACSSKKGVSALQIKRMTGLSYKSALFLMHRIRFAMADAPGTLPQIGGNGQIVEADETYVGGRPRIRSKSERERQRHVSRRSGNRECVLGMIERGGEIRPVHVTGKDGVQTSLFEHVSTDAKLMTDESSLLLAGWPPVPLARGREALGI